MRSATWANVRARRLARCGLAERAAAGRLVAIAGDLGGVQAQVQASAELQLAARVGGIVRADVQDALWERRELVKAWTLRGTLHLHPAEELPLWFAARRAVSGVGHEGLEAWRDPAGALHAPLDEAEVKETRAAVREALDGRALLREEIAATVVERVGPGPRARLLSGFAFFFDELCQGPPQGAKITLARPDQWIDGWQEVDEQVALREVVRRFLSTYGPARPADFRAWFGGRGLAAADARALFDSLGDELEEIDVEGHRASVLAGDSVFPEPRPSLRLLPEYDGYIMGFREREQLVPDAARKQVAAHSRGRYEGPAGVRFVVVDGVAAGHWERRRRGKRLDLRVTMTRRLTRQERAALAVESERIGAFLELEPVVTIAHG